MVAIGWGGGAGLGLGFGLGGGAGFALGLGLGGGGSRFRFFWYRFGFRFGRGGVRISALWVYQLETLLSLSVVLVFFWRLFSRVCFWRVCFWSTPQKYELLDQRRLAHGFQKISFNKNMRTKHSYCVACCRPRLKNLLCLLSKCVRTVEKCI